MASEALGSVLRVVGPGELTAAIDARNNKRAAMEDQALADVTGAGEMSSLAGFVRGEFDVMRRHRDNQASGWSERLINALRVFNGIYDPAKLREIERFGGSKIFARIVAMKCRGASSLLRDVYLSSDRPWGLDASDDPKVPPEIVDTVSRLVQMEAQSLMQGGQPPDITKIRDRTQQLVEAARQAAKKKAENGARIGEDKLDEILKEGGFYKALAEFITDLPLFPFAVLKGPVVRIMPVVTWEGNQATIKQTPRLTWARVSPFDIWWTPGVSDIEDAAVIERTRLTRADLNDLMDLPGYNAEAIREILDLHGRGGLTGETDTLDSERAVQESRENPQLNQSRLIDCLAYVGNVQGRMLVDAGMSPETIPDPLRDYFVQIWTVGRWIIKVQLAPSPRKRHSYYITSFEKVPGTVVGNGLPDILNDVQDAGNATLRALINNMSIASGPQVTVNDDRVADNADGEDLYPWKRWHVTSDPMNGGAALKPIDFFQPQSNAQELLGVYEKFVTMADELSAIPKYMSGAGAGSGAGRTASGLAMLMGNASKILQTVAANIDRDVIDPLLTSLFDMVMLTDQSGLLNGDEKVRVLGVAVAVQKETQRARQLEFLQITANPIDAQILGPRGRATILRHVSTTIGLPGEQIVPSDDELEAQQKAAQNVAQAQGIPGHGGMGEQAAQAQGDQPSQLSQDTGPRTQIAGGNH